MLEEQLSKNNELLAKLISSIENLTNALNSNQVTTSSPAPTSAPVVENATTEEAPAKEVAPAVEEAKTFTLAEIRSVCVKAGENGHTDVVVSFLESKGVKKLTELDPSFYVELYNYLSAKGVL